MVLPFLIPLAISLAKEFVPDLIGSLVGDGAGKVAEKLVGIASDLTGEKDPAAILAAMKADKKLAAELQIQMSEERIALAQLEQRDRASARHMSMKSELHTWAQIIISILVTGGFGYMLSTVIEKGMAESNAVSLMMLGTLATGFAQVLNFWLGSSRSSQEKSQMLVDASKR
jgi:hypothetical protein